MDVNISSSYKNNIEVIHDFIWAGDLYQCAIINDYELLKQSSELRYRSYIEERHCSIETANHLMKSIYEIEDRFAHIFAIIKNHEEVIATARGLYSPVPQPIFENLSPLYEFELLEPVHKNNFAIFNYVVIDNEYRRQGPFLSELLKGIYHHAVANGVFFIYANANSHLLRLWRHVGYREYKNKEVSDQFGVITPLYLNLLDLDHLKKVNSPLFNTALEFQKYLNPIPLNTAHQTYQPTKAQLKPRGDRAVNRTQKIEAAFASAYEKALASTGFMRISEKTITPAHYASFMRQTFHAAHNNPQAQALAAVHFKGAQRKMVKKFFQHAIAEIAHDEMAKKDMEFLGYYADGIHSERPLPETMALIAFPFFQIQHKNPLGYLGYLYFLEFLPTTYGQTVVQLFLDIGVPKEAMSFICEHVTVDEGHNRLMLAYLNELVLTDADADEVCYAIEVTGKLYANMVEASFRAVDEGYNYARYSADESELLNVLANPNSQRPNKEELLVEETA